MQNRDHLATNHPQGSRQKCYLQSEGGEVLHKVPEDVRGLQSVAIVEIPADKHSKKVC
jgi:hypothetical protein